jgi:hypothetical protein
VAYSGNGIVLHEALVSTSEKTEVGEDKCHHGQDQGDCDGESRQHGESCVMLLVWEELRVLL